MLIKARQTQLIGLISGLLIILAVPTHSLAAGTASGTSISNIATIDFNVSGVPQPQISSDGGTPTAFLVDTKVDMTMTTVDVAAITAAPGSSGNVLTFTVTNTGNATHDFSLAAIDLAGGLAAFGGSDNKNASAVSIFVESGGTSNYQAAQDTATHIDELAADATATVYIVSNFDFTVINNDIASYHLQATVRASTGDAALGGVIAANSGAVDTPGSIDIVFADGIGSSATPADDTTYDGKFTSQSDYKISSATMTATMTTNVISDPFNNTTNPKAIPGAVIEYTVQVDNAVGGTTVDNVTVVVNLNADIVAGRLLFNTQYNVTPAQGILASFPGFLNQEYTNAVDVNEHGTAEADWNNSAVNSVTLSGINLLAGESATLKFRVTIQ